MSRDDVALLLMKKHQLEPGTFMQIEPIYRRFWWPHPYAMEAGLLWRKLVIRYRYFVDGREISL